MKRLFLSLLAIAGTLFPLLAQTEGDPAETESLPVESLTLRKQQIPQLISNEIRSDILAGKPVIKDKLPTVKDNYPWINTTESNRKSPAFYEAFIKGYGGTNIFVKYNPDGTVTESEVMRKNAALPHNVAEDLAKSQYSGWNVISDREVLKYVSSEGDIREHFRITVEKNNTKKNVTFDYVEPV
jgi:hypothetical protein